MSNPAKDEVEIIIKNIEEGLCHLKIMNSLGQLLFEEKLDCKQDRHQIATTNFKPGIYYVSLFLPDEQLKTKKLLIIR